MYFDEVNTGAGEDGCNDVRRTIGVNPVDSESSSSISCKAVRGKCGVFPLRTVAFVILLFQVRRGVRGVVGGDGGDTSLSRVHATTAFLLLAAGLPTLTPEDIRRTVVPAPVPVRARRVRLNAIGRFKSSLSRSWSVMLDFC